MEEMKIVEKEITISELKEMSSRMYDELVKAVVDIEKGIMAVDAEMHADEEQLLLQNGSRQQDLWGINLYPANPMENWVEFDSMINLRPSQGNRSRGVDDPIIQNKILAIVNSLVKR